MGPAPLGADAFLPVGLAEVSNFGLGGGWCVGPAPLGADAFLPVVLQGSLIPLGDSGVGPTFLEVSLPPCRSVVLGSLMVFRETISQKWKVANGW